MTLKMNKSYQQNASAAVKQTLAIAPTTTINTQKNNQEQLLHTDCVDVDSIKGRFSWKLIDGYQIPYIIRVINGVKLKFVSVRMAETELLSKFVHSLHTDMYTCTSVRSYFITDNEAKLLNDINNFHSDFAFGKAIFFARKDDIVLLEDVYEFYKFIDMCYKLLLFNNNTGRKEKCGFIHINSISVVPYCIINSQKYVPLFCFECETENLQQSAVKLENWNLAYLKFCIKVQGFSNNEYFVSDSCTVISLDDIKNSYSTETNFEEYWPPKIIDTQLLTNQKSTHLNPSGAWIKASLEVVISENSTIPHTLTESASMLQQSMPVMINIYQNGWSANQMGSALSQSSSLINDAGHIVSPPLIDRAGNMASVIDNSVSYSNVVPISQCMTTINNSIANSQAQKQQIQQQQHQQQIITSPQGQPSYNSQSVHGGLTNNQLHKALKNNGPIVTTPATEIIDLPSLPSVPPTIQNTSLCPNYILKLKRLPERIWENITNTAAYKIKKAPLQGKMIFCINAYPYKYSKLMVTLNDLMRIVLPLCTVARCTHILQKFLKTTVFSGNFEQLALLRESGRLSSINPEDTHMAMLQDIKHVLTHLKIFVSMQDEQIEKYQSTERPSKKPCIS